MGGSEYLCAGIGILPLFNSCCPSSQLVCRCGGMGSGSILPRGKVPMIRRVEVHVEKK
jgi:hypothetical protein